MTAEIISVGTELLLGNILNTNAQYLSRELAALGITVQRESTIGDNHGRLADFVNEAKQRCDLLVFTGTMACLRLFGVVLRPVRVKKSTIFCHSSGSKASVSP